MKRTSWIAGVGLFFCVATIALAAERQRLPEPPRPVRICDPVCQLRAQDWAFSLLVETYREYRSHQIEVNYNKRMEAVAGISKLADNTLVIHAPLRFVEQLQGILSDIAVADRNRGLQMVQTQVANLQTAYDCARKHDEQVLGVKVEKNINPRVAARELKQYVVSRPDLLSGNIAQTPVEPASTVLRDTPAVSTDPKLLAETCE